MITVITRSTVKKEKWQGLCIEVKEIKMQVDKKEWGKLNSNQIQTQ